MKKFNQSVLLMSRIKFLDLGKNFLHFRAGDSSNGNGDRQGREPLNTPASQQFVVHLRSGFFHHFLEDSAISAVLKYDGVRYLRRAVQLKSGLDQPQNESGIESLHDFPFEDVFGAGPVGASASSGQ